MCRHVCNDVEYRSFAYFDWIRLVKDKLPENTMPEIEALPLETLVLQVRRERLQ